MHLPTLLPAVVLDILRSLPRLVWKAVSIHIFYARLSASWFAFRVYSILDWDLPEMSLLTVIGVSVFVVLVTFLAYGMFRLRTFLYESFEEVHCYRLC